MAIYFPITIMTLTVSSFHYFFTLTRGGGGVINVQNCQPILGTPNEHFGPDCGPFSPRCPQGEGLQNSTPVLIHSEGGLTWELNIKPVNDLLIRRLHNTVYLLSMLYINLDIQNNFQSALGRQVTE